MHRDTTYKEKFAILKDWMPKILDSVKKDLRNDHLKNDWEFFKRYFGSKNINKLTTDDFVTAYSNAIDEVDADRAEQISEFIANRWLMRHTELYDFFEKQLSQITSNFQDLEILSEEDSRKILDPALKQYSPFNIYIFSILNSVVFPQNVYDDLRKKAQSHHQTMEEQEAIELKERSIDGLKTAYEQQLARLQDKYEKKLGGLQKKYIQDTEALKKQLSTLQRKLSGSTSS